MQTVKIIANPFNNIGFVAMITSGKYANRSYVADGRSTYGRWDTQEDAKAAAVRYGYTVESN